MADMNKTNGMTATSNGNKPRVHFRNNASIPQQQKNINNIKSALSSSPKHEREQNGHLPPNITTTTTTTATTTTTKSKVSENETETKKPSSRHPLSFYWLAMRPWSFGNSLVPVALGCALAHKATGEFNPWVLLVTCFTAVSVHAAGNVVNTYFDYQKGIDSKKSDDRTLVDKILTPDEMVQLGALAYGLGCVGFIVLVLLSPARMEHLALVYFGGLSSSFLYTGGVGLKYIGLGDLLVFIIFGPVTVLFAYMTQTGSGHAATLLYALPLALNTEAMLHVNNTRDMESDRRAGIYTLAILLGHTGSHVMFAILLLAPYIGLAVAGLHCTPVLLLPLITVPNAFHLVKEFRQGHLRHLPRRTGKLNFYFGLFYVLACVVAGRDQLPALQIISQPAPVW